MRFITQINSVKCLEWGLNANQGSLVDLLNQLESWAKVEVVDGEAYYWVSRQKVCEEIPLFYTKTDTVYRAFKLLSEKGLIEYITRDKRDLIRLTEKGKTWNFSKHKNSEINPSSDKSSEINPNFTHSSEINPKKLGNKSEKTRKCFRKNSEINPTYKDISYKDINDKDTNDKNTNARDALECEKPNLELIAQDEIPKPKPKKPKKINIEFEEVWDLYDKKVGSIKKLKSKWEKLTNQERQLALERIPEYVQATPDKQYRKNFETYLNNESWKDEITQGASNASNQRSDELYRTLTDDSWADGFGEDLANIPSGQADSSRIIQGDCSNISEVERALPHH